ncbi:hypothetical protein GCM10011345_31280 [Gemmobacter megaterium]|nr:hypothetical protein GCM10011345_31280 [Gemmobacter megaterium]
MHHHFAIGCQMDIQFDMAIAQRHRMGKGGHGVLLAFKASAAMGEGRGQRAIKKGVRVRHDHMMPNARHLSRGKAGAWQQSPRAAMVATDQAERP